MTDEQTPRKRNKQTHLSGNLGGDAKVINTKNGDLVKFSLAVPVTFGTKDDPGETFWVDVAIFDDKMKDRAYGPVVDEETGERKQSPDALRKGDRVAVIGPLSFRTVENDSGTREFASIIANRLAGPFDWWERTPFTPGPSSSSSDWQPPF